MHQVSFKRHRFPPNIICHSIWLSNVRLCLRKRTIEPNAVAHNDLVVGNVLCGWLPRCKE